MEITRPPAASSHSPAPANSAIPALTHGSGFSYAPHQNARLQTGIRRVSPALRERQSLRAFIFPVTAGSLRMKSL